ncbi:putative inner membrane spanin component [Brevundimonas phage vB_BpoS-Papperlapapp]|uniref:Inner membrane spanin component n=2 Tax=Marchewkavirus TaxID=3425052 RepID=A0A9E7MQ23_9CAUD|nr:putative inner membrane spanin component [Brevundimonas phage vB_BpoS-Kabachok]USN14913.1 putative inner membrane spanin component [Brevundimonas phage vB_BpoS-Domovoi]USN16286.1 putative inner membrane spanin component [Brevundimonas phage vB_BpoS-Papperlapapp]
MFSILLALLLNPATLWTIAAVCAAVVALWFTVGPAFVIKIASDIRTWFILGLVLAVLAFAHSEKRADALEAQIAGAARQAQADQDAQKSQARRAAQRDVRRSQNDRITERIEQAPQGRKHDAALDGIAAERPDYHGAQDEALDRRAEAQARPTGGAPAGDQPAADGLRKQPDGVVVP